MRGGKRTSRDLTIEDFDRSSIDELAKEIGVSTQQIRRRRLELGLPPLKKGGNRAKPIPEELRLKWIDLYVNEGRNLATICERFPGISRTLIRDAIREHVGKLERGRVVHHGWCP